MDHDNMARASCDLDTLMYAQCSRRAAIQSFAVPKFYALARKVIFRLQRAQRPCFYSEHYEYKSAWDEYCHDWQNGDGDFESAWDLLVDPILKDVAGRVASEDTLLLTLQAYEDLEIGIEYGADGSVEPSAKLIAMNIRDKLREYAGDRDILKFDPLERE
jgi:hypothetical protein